VRNSCPSAMPPATALSWFACIYLLLSSSNAG
jgi:hypothetical protein